LGVDFAFKVESVPFVCQVTWYEKEDEFDPKKQIINCEEGAVIEHDARPTDHGGEQPDGSSERRYDEFRTIPSADDICSRPDVEPGQKADDQSHKGVCRQLIPKPQPKINQ